MHVCQTSSLRWVRTWARAQLLWRDCWSETVAVSKRITVILFSLCYWMFPWPFWQNSITVHCTYMYVYFTVRVHCKVLYNKRRYLNTSWGRRLESNELFHGFRMKHKTFFEKSETIPIKTSIDRTFYSQTSRFWLRIWTLSNFLSYEIREAVWWFN